MLVGDSKVGSQKLWRRQVSNNDRHALPRKAHKIDSLKPFLLAQLILLSVREYFLVSHTYCWYSRGFSSFYSTIWQNWIVINPKHVVHALWLPCSGIKFSSWKFPLHAVDYAYQSFSFNSCVLENSFNRRCEIHHRRSHHPGSQGEEGGLLSLHSIVKTLAAVLRFINASQRDVELQNLAHFLQRFYHPNSF